MRNIIFIFLVLNMSMLALGKRIAVLNDLIRPGAIIVNKDVFCISDEYSIRIYNLKTFKLNTKFGRRGKGPGDFEIRAPFIRFSDNTITVNDSLKLMLFSTKGKLIREIKKTSWESLSPVNKNFMKIKFNFNMKTRNIKTKVSILDNKLIPIKDIYFGELEGVNISISSDTGKETKKMTPHIFRVLTNKDKIFIADSKKGFYIKIFDFKGNEANTINLKIKEISVTSEYKEKEIEKLKETKAWNRIKNNNFLFYKNFPKMKDFFVNNERIIVATHKVRKNKNEFIILNKKGEILKKVFLPLEKTVYTFYKNKYYYLKENESTETWELFSITI